MVLPDPMCYTCAINRGKLLPSKEQKQIRNDQEELKRFTTSRSKKEELLMFAENREKIQDLKKRLKILGDFL